MCVNARMCAREGEREKERERERKTGQNVCFSPASIFVCAGMYICAGACVGLIFDTSTSVYACECVVNWCECVYEFICLCPCQCVLILDYIYICVRPPL